MRILSLGSRSSLVGAQISCAVRWTSQPTQVRSDVYVVPAVLLTPSRLSLSTSSCSFLHQHPRRFRQPRCRCTCRYVSSAPGAVDVFRGCHLTDPFTGALTSALAIPSSTPSPMWLFRKPVLSGEPTPMPMSVLSQYLRYRPGVSASCNGASRHHT